ncbi:MAG: glycosyltransferase, partial [Thermoproteota archaeon]
MKSNRLLNQSQKETLLIATPELAGGSWVSIYEFVKNTFTKSRIVVVTLGRAKEIPRGMLIFNIPYPSYQKLGPSIGSNLLFVLLYKAPLFLMLTMVSFIYRPYLIIGNGFITSIACILPARILKARILASYHGHIRYTIHPASRRIIKAFCHFFDLVTVNSIGSKEDASLVVDPNKILVIEHSADEIFFLQRDRETLRKEMGLEDKFVILYVGRMDVEKSFDILLDVFRRLRTKNGIILFVAGTGNLEDQVRTLEKQTESIRYFGYLTDRHQLAALYKVADIVWSYADETYLARPAVEALASGTPII